MADDLTTLQARRDEAAVALHNLATGSRVEEVWSRDGRKMRFTNLTRSDLQDYINTLDALIADLTSAADSSVLPRRRFIATRY